MAKQKETSAMEIDDQTSTPSDQITTNPKFSVNGKSLCVETSSFVSPIAMKILECSYLLDHWILTTFIWFCSVTAFKICSNAAWIAIRRLRSLQVRFHHISTHMFSRKLGMIRFEWFWCKRINKIGICRRYCTARLRRLYKSLKFTHGRVKYTKRAISVATVTEVRCVCFYVVCDVLLLLVLNLVCYLSDGLVVISQFFGFHWLN